MLSNRPDHRSKRIAGKAAHRWKRATICRDNARNMQELAVEKWLNKAAAHLAIRVSIFVNQRGQFYATKVQALQMGRRALNLYWLEGRGKIRQGAR